MLIHINKKPKICHNMPFRAEKNIIPGRNCEINFFNFFLIFIAIRINLKEQEIPMVKI